ncbi:transcription repressor OFP7-like [Cucurbita pepo subsp. pepo]|uniref:transcription repressor OFP7-like n=1 Tax=Cucurbita pepo subsp. pepo TaxID=3664 RepID=UPI000C9D6410|nr:transcription repressor OFP7-like [Cucurbita pepo subsp. pepo]
MMMAKQFRLLRIPSFQCCRSSDISVVPTDPPPPPSPSSKPHHYSSLRRHVSSAFRTAACGRRSLSTNSDDDQITKSSPKHPRHVPPTPLPESYDDALPLPKQQRRRKKKSKSTTLARLRISTSSTESGLFSSESFDEIDELEETETLISSSKTISSTDDDDSSSEFNPQLETIREKPYKGRNKINLKNKKKKKEKRHRSSNRRQKPRRMIKTSPSPESESPARLSVFQRLIPCTVDGKIRESFAVVKKSEDPFEDFKRSMMEMIMEKEMFDEKDLEQLLHCLLSLNDREHHGIIVEAFSEIWQSLFCNKSTSRTSF